MALTTAERAEINRQNARKSTGPRSDDGKAASRRNATKHGLRAEVLTLPDEDPTLAAARADAWNDYYQPRSPGAQHLVNDCVAATLLSDRCHKYHAVALSRQIRQAERTWDLAREDAVAVLALLIQTDPAEAVNRLKQSAHGLRWMIEGWERLDAALKERGKWTNPERDLAIRLQGFRPEPEHIRACPEAWVTRLFALLCHGNPSDEAIRFLFDESRLPDLYRRNVQVGFRPDREESRHALQTMTAEALQRLRQAEETMQAFDEPDRAEAGDRALILHDPVSARLFLRYHSEARNSFHRAYSALLKTLDRDADHVDEADSGPETVASNDAGPPEPAHSNPADPVSPNEADSAASSMQIELSEDWGDPSPAHREEVGTAGSRSPSLDHPPTGGATPLAA